MFEDDFCNIIFFMNWMIISSKDFEVETNNLASYFNEKNYTPSIYFVSNDSINNLEQFYIDIHQVTHCVFISDGTVPLNPHLFYATGFLNGAGIPVFVAGLNRTAEQKQVLPNYYFYADMDELVQNIEHNLPKYIADEEKKKAHKKLFDQGIPFTPDCFSSYISKNDVDICNLFVEAGMSVNVRDAAGTPMLCIAARAGRKDMIEWLVERGAEINAISKDRGYSPVMDAVWKSSLDIVELLIKLGADLNIVSNDGQTALIVATGASNPRICEVLVRNGADPNFKDRMGMSSLEYARLFKKQILIPLYEEFAK